MVVADVDGWREDNGIYYSTALYFFFCFPDPFFGGPFPRLRSTSSFSIRRSSCAVR